MSCLTCVRWCYCSCRIIPVLRTISLQCQVSLVKLYNWIIFNKVTSQVLLPLASRKLIVAVTQIWFCVFYSNVNSYVFCKQFWDIFLVFWYSVISSSYFLFLCVSILFQELSFAVSETFTHISTYTLRFCVFENTDAFTLFGWKVLVFFIIWSSVNSKKEYLTRKLNKDQAPVVQRMDDAIC